MKPGLTYHVVNERQVHAIVAQFRKFLLVAVEHDLTVDVNVTVNGKDGDDVAQAVVH